MPSAASVMSQQPYHQPPLPCSSEKSFAELAQMPPAQVTGAAASTAVRASPMGARRASVSGSSPILPHAKSTRHGSQRTGSSLPLRGFARAVRFVEHDVFEVGLGPLEGAVDVLLRDRRRRR